MITVSHIAGPAITIMGAERVIQRCSLCGEKLIDSKGMAAPLNPDGSAPQVCVWEVGRFVQVTEGNPTMYLLLPPSQKLPDDSCIVLVEN